MIKEEGLHLPAMQPQIYSKNTHQIDPKHIDTHAHYIIAKLQDAGYKAYLVGGGVRDLLVGVIPKDFDISTSAKPEEIKKLFRNCLLIGRRFRLAHIRWGRKVYEVSTFRAGATESDELIVRDNVWGSEEEDVLRRDFTINGLYYDPSNETVIDYVGGYDDAKKGLIRSIGTAFVRFKQDPVRMIRLLKFKARFNFTIEKEDAQALIDCRQEIIKSSQARLLEEMLRMLESGHAATFFKLLTDHGFTAMLLPELAPFLETHKEEAIKCFLDKADEIHRDPENKKLDRALLLACFIFPVLDDVLKHHHDSHPLHLGQVFSITQEVFHDLMSPFFQIPRRLKMKTINVLGTQYRFTPLKKVAGKSLRTPHVEDAKHAFNFFTLREQIFPGLTETHQRWVKHLEKHPFKEIEPEERPRRRRRRR